jgi:phosphoglycolate phosphatase
MTAINYFLFDYDGTLCHTQDTISQAMVETFQKYELAVPDQLTRQQVISSGVTIYEAMTVMHPQGKTLKASYLEDMVKSYRSIYSEIDGQYTTLYAGAGELLSALKAAGKTIVILSNKGYQTVENSLKFFELQQYTYLLIADGSPVMANLKMKPDPASYLSVIKKQFQIVNDQEVLMIGDTYSDLLFALNCGIRSCWAAYGYGDQQLCKTLNPDYEIQELTEFSRLVSWSDQA